MFCAWNLRLRAMTMAEMSTRMEEDITSQKLHPRCAACESTALLANRIAPIRPVTPSNKYLSDFLKTKTRKTNGRK